MYGYVLDNNYVPIAIVDHFESFIWTDRFAEAGDFELRFPAQLDIFKEMQLDRYLYNPKSEHYMIIETIEVETDATSGTMATITGRSLESILDRRIVWNKTDISGNLQDGIKKLLEENIINPEIPGRKIPNFIFTVSEDPKITELTHEASYHGEDLYTIITDICALYDIGFCIMPVGDGVEEGGFNFYLTTGTDRSWKQDTLPWVVFSDKYENLLNSTYASSHMDYKTAACVIGEDDLENTITEEVLRVDKTGLARYEIFVDSGEKTDTDGFPEEEDYDADQSGDLSFTEQKKYDEAADKIRQQKITEMREVMKTKGNEELAKTKVTEAFNGDIQARAQFVYGVDFFMGDIVQVINSYGREGRCRVTEVIMTHDTSQETILPSFVSVEEDEDESK